MFATRLYVGGLTNPDVSPREIAEFLQTLGVFRVKSVELVADPLSGQRRGFAFCNVVCNSEEQFRLATQKYSGSKWKRCKLRLGAATTPFDVRLKQEWEEEARIQAEIAARVQEERDRELQAVAHALDNTQTLLLSTSGAHCRKRTRIRVPFGPQSVAPTSSTKRLRRARVIHFDADGNEIKSATDVTDGVNPSDSQSNDDGKGDLSSNDNEASSDSGDSDSGDSGDSSDSDSDSRGGDSDDNGDAAENINDEEEGDASTKDEGVTAPGGSGGDVNSRDAAAGSESDGSDDSGDDSDDDSDDNDSDNAEPETPPQDEEAPSEYDDQDDDDAALRSILGIDSLIDEEESTPSSESTNESAQTASNTSVEDAKPAHSTAVSFNHTARAQQSRETIVRSKEEVSVTESKPHEPVSNLASWRLLGFGR